MLHDRPMHRFAFPLVAFAALVGLAVATPTTVARADAPADPDASRLSAAGHSLKWNWTPPGHNDRFGHAETLIHAPAIDVKRLVLDYARYKELAPSITTSRVVQHWPDGSSDVYLAMGVLNNTISFWNVTRFQPPKSSGNDEVIEGKMVPGKGNIDNSQVIWTVRPVSEGWTVLKFDVLLNPGLPAPQSLIDEQLRDSAMDAVNSIHDRVQGSKDFVPFSG
jgi:hypothetical protein